MKYKLLLITALCSSTVSGQENITKEQRLLEAKQFAEQETKKVQELVQQLIKERNSAKTDEEKAAFTRKLQLMLKQNDNKLVDLHKKRKIAFFKMIFHGIKKTANENQTLPMELNHKKIYSRIDLNTVTYIGGLNIDATNANETILVYENEPDENGYRHILFLDGHVEISKMAK